MSNNILSYMETNIEFLNNVICYFDNFALVRRP